MIRSRRRPAPILAVALAVLLGGLGVAACTVAGPFEVSASASQDLAIDLPADATGVRVRIEMFNGHVEVVAGPAGHVSARVETSGVGATQAEAEADRARIEVTLDASADGSVLLRAVYPPSAGSTGNRSASATVEVPAEAALDIRTSNGFVTTSGVVGPVDVRTSNGAVTLEDVAKGATVRSSNGAVELGGGGLLDLETSNARIAVRGAAATLRAVTSNGDVSFEGTFADGAQLVQTSNNPITVRLPASASFSLTARTSNSKVTVDGFDLRTTGADTGATLVGAVGTGGPSITLSTSNAAIVVSAR